MKLGDSLLRSPRAPRLGNLLALCAMVVAPVAAGQADAGDSDPARSPSADNVWRFADQPNDTETRFAPDAYRAARMDRDTLLAVLERVSERRYNEPLPVLTLPMPDGAFARFTIRAAPQQGREAVQAYRGQSLDEGDARIEWTAKGLHAVVRTSAGSVYIDPVPGVPGDYLTYFARDAGRPLLDGSDLPLAAVRQIETLMTEKQERNPVQRKIDSRLLDAWQMVQGKEVVPAYNRLPVELEATDAPTARPKAYDARDQNGAGRVLVDLRADVTPAVLARIEELGGEVVNSVGKYRAIRAWLPLDSMEVLAALDEVQWIRVADRAMTNREMRRSKSISDSVVAQATDKVDRSEGDAAHDVPGARAEYGVDGTGVGIGVLSNGIGTLADRQASGDLPDSVVILDGQAGERYDLEGTAMLEIVHDLAPGAHLYFATAFGSPAQFAANIEALCEAGADVIVDDVIWFAESAFQDDVVAKGVNAAVEAGCFYFSAAGNGGNLNDGTASVWEGDFADAGDEPQVGVVSVGDQHEFADGVSANRITKAAVTYLLKWADPLGASANDYDLYLLDESLTTVVDASTNVQDGEQDPFEVFDGLPGDVGMHLVVVRSEGEARYIRLNAYDGELEHATAGQIFGHVGAESAISVAAVSVLSARGEDGVFDGSESVETFSSDGPRRMFFQPDGTPITPGSFSSTGGEVLDKPDIAAADGVRTSTPGFELFEGTSAAAPHAAAIAALMVEAAGGRNRIAPATLRAALTKAALDIEAPGPDRDSGAGIPLAPAAVSGVVSGGQHRAPTGTLQDQTLSVNDDDLKLDLSTLFDDPDGEVLSYTALTGIEGVVAITRSGSILTIDPLAPGTATLAVRATDPGGLSVVRMITITVDRDYGETDYDSDDDGLIEITSLEQLDALRYDLDGDGATEVPADWNLYFEVFDDAQEDMGCVDGCAGFELVADLDFDDPGSYASGAVDHGWSRGENGAGWVPIGTREPGRSRDSAFAATFDGNGHTIANLFINRPESSFVGLFGYATEGRFLGIGLTDVDITGDEAVGALAGSIILVDNRSPTSEVRTSFATGRVSGADAVGGLIGWSQIPIRDCRAAVRVSGDLLVGGLVGLQGMRRIESSFATGVVSGGTSVGGLVGSNLAEIVSSYATGAVSGKGSRHPRLCAYGGVGGLLGNACAGFVMASYATGRVSAMQAAGGLVGSKTANQFLIGFSYWDVETSGLVVGVGDDDANDNGTLDDGEIPTRGIRGMTTAALQAPTGYEGIYADWQWTRNDFPPLDVWHFGNSQQYPALKADHDDDGAATWQEFGNQIRDRPVLTVAAAGGQASLSWTPVTRDHWTPLPDLTYAVYRDDTRDDTIVATESVIGSYTDTPPGDGRESALYQVVALVDNGEASRSNFVRVQNRAPTPPRVAHQSAQAGTSFGYTFGPATDPDGDEITFSATDLPGWLTFAAASRTFSGSPMDGDKGTVEITVTAADDGTPVLSASAAFNLTVNALAAGNRAPAPVGTLDAVSLPTGDTLSVPVERAFEDADGDVLGYDAATSDGDVAAVHISGGAVVVTGIGAGGATVTVTASDGALTATQSFEATVVNAEPEALGSVAERTLLIPGAPVILTVSGAFHDADGDALTFVAGSSDNEVAEASASRSTVTITPFSVGSATITVTATDQDGSNSTATQEFEVEIRRDYDGDGDGLIEIAELGQLDAVRFDRNGDGTVDPEIGFHKTDPLPHEVAAYQAAYPDAAANMGCANACTGYELVADLDFDTDLSGGVDKGDAYWNDGRGWQPIGQIGALGPNIRAINETFQATFDGNGHVISNLFIDRPDEQSVGLFALIDVDRVGRGLVRNLGLADVDVTGGGEATGSIAGKNYSVIETSYATGRVRDIASVRVYRSNAAGGLVGQNGWENVSGVIRNSYAAMAVSADANLAGGLAGLNGRSSRIDASFATGVVESTSRSGGLVAFNRGEVTDSYATGRSAVTFGSTGGLIAINEGAVTRSYATGRPTPALSDGESRFPVRVGGLASLSTGVILESYWDTGTSGWQVGVGGDDLPVRNGRIDDHETATPGVLGKSTAELQRPEGYGGIYENWNAEGSETWHLGSSAQYPGLRADVNGDGEETWQEFGYQLRDTPRLTASIEDGKAKLVWSLVDTGHWDPEPMVRYAVFRDGELVATDLEGSSYTDDSPGVDYQIAALVNGGEASRSGISIVVAHCHQGTTWRLGEKCRIAPTSFAFEINEDGTACVSSSCSTGDNLDLRFATGHITIRLVAKRNADGTWTLSGLTPEGPTNREPNAIGLVKPVTLASEGGSVTVDVEPFFEDPDGDELSYMAETSRSDVATVTMAESRLTIASTSEGQTTVTVTARDPGGLFATQAIDVTVTTMDVGDFRWVRGWRLKILVDHAERSAGDENDTPEG